MFRSNTWLSSERISRPFADLVAGIFIGTDVTGMVTNPDGVPNNGDELGSSVGVSIEAGALGLTRPQSNAGGMRYQTYPLSPR